MNIIGSLTLIEIRDLILEARQKMSSLPYEEKLELAVMSEYDIEATLEDLAFAIQKTLFGN